MARLLGPLLPRLWRPPGCWPSHLHNATCPRGCIEAASGQTCKSPGSQKQPANWPDADLAGRDGAGCADDQCLLVRAYALEQAPFSLDEGPAPLVHTCTDAPPSAWPRRAGVADSTAAGGGAAGSFARVAAA